MLIIIHLKQLPQFIYLYKFYNLIIMLLIIYNIIVSKFIYVFYYIVIELS